MDWWVGGLKGRDPIRNESTSWSDPSCRYWSTQLELSREENRFGGDGSLIKFMWGVDVPDSTRYVDTNRDRMNSYFNMVGWSD